MWYSLLQKKCMLARPDTDPSLHEPALLVVNIDPTNDTSLQRYCIDPSLLVPGDSSLQVLAGIPLLKHLMTQALISMTEDQEPHLQTMNEVIEEEQTMTIIQSENPAI